MFNMAFSKTPGLFICTIRLVFKELIPLFKLYLGGGRGAPLEQWLSGKEATCQCRSRRHMFNPWAWKISWRRKWQLTPVFLPEKSYGQRSLAVTVHGVNKESDTTEQLIKHTHFFGMDWLSLFGQQCFLVEKTFRKKNHLAKIIKPYLRWKPDEDRKTY